MTIADRLSHLMRRRGIKSQSRLARLCGVSQSCIHKILSRGDDYAVQCRTVTKLARGLHTSVSWLVDGDEGLEQRLPRESPATRSYDDLDNVEIQALLEKLPPSVRKSVLVLLQHLVAQ
jgi:DNA-binding Xre family transcriptional regulator